ncbi:hypothetical protein [Phreatobacter oligotrophus]|uniref:Uncharacterized protein n=1 Tax=Phreatobacter oligotrophus TaxID=1122261 RepID=A0A2T4YLD3_9HYPH|nr:hypothetical protein [Phreatobacter oligotrophus]PTM43839.1 hypothetical protein C8P69_1424 [Phreatobacter oligotrophus]
MNFRTLALATLAIAPLATGAIAQEAGGSSFLGTPERDIVNTVSPREFSAPRVSYRSAMRVQADATGAQDHANVPEAFSSAGQ